MGWVVLAAAYLVVGIGVFAWCNHSDGTTDSDQKKRSARVFALVPELCLFWPIVLFMKLKRRKMS